MENSWIVFDHVKYLQDWTTMVCHVYDNKYCKVLTIASCDIQSEDARAHIIFGGNLLLSWWSLISPISASKDSW